MARLTIERDEAQGEGRRRRAVALALDGRTWLRADPEALAELGLADGDEVDERRRAEIEDKLVRAQARLFVLRSLAVRPQSVAELERKLAARGIPQDFAREAIEVAVRYRYLDDAALAGQLARGLRSRGYGQRRAAQTLRARGIGGEEAEAALREAYGDEDEVALALAVIARRSLSGDEAGKQRAVAFLVRRGFSTGAAWAAVKEALAARAGE